MRLIINLNSAAPLQCAHLITILISFANGVINISTSKNLGTSIFILRREYRIYNKGRHKNLKNIFSNFIPAFPYSGYISKSLNSPTKLQNSHLKTHHCTPFFSVPFTLALPDWLFGHSHPDWFPLICLGSLGLQLLPYSNQQIAKCRRPILGITANKCNSF